MRISIVLASILLPTVSLAQSFRGIGDLPGGNHFSSIRGISADGTRAVGFSDTTLGTEAFLWTEANEIVGLGDLAGGNRFSRAIGISDDGNVIVGVSTSVNGNEAFRWTEQAGMIGLGDFAGGLFNSIARSASFDGSVIVGEGSTVRNVVGQPNLPVAFRWTEATGMTQLGVIPPGTLQSAATDLSGDGSVIVGESALGPFVHNGSSMTFIGELPGGSFDPLVYGVSADGRVVVGTDPSENGPEAYRWTAETGMVGLGELPGGIFDSKAFAISSDGQVIVGTDKRDTEFNQAFVWREEIGMYDLRLLLAAAGADIAGWQLDEAFAVSADGNIVAGEGRNPQGQVEGWIASVPSPPAEDFDGDQFLDCADVDPLVAAIASGSNPPEFDLTADGLVNTDDLDQWLIVAGRVNNFLTAAPMLPGDANLDGTVDGRDFVEWNNHKFAALPSWCAGDFNADGIVDGQDFLVWNANKFTSSARPVPEPNVGTASLLLALSISRSLRFYVI